MAVRSPRRLVLVFVSTWAFLACDPTLATVVENVTDQPVLIEVQIYSQDGFPSSTFEVAGGTRVEVGSNGVGSLGQVWRVSLLDEECNIIRSEPVLHFEEGGVVEVGPAGSMTLRAGGNPTGDVAIPTDRCS